MKKLNKNLKTESFQQSKKPAVCCPQVSLKTRFEKRFVIKTKKLERKEKILASCFPLADINITLNTLNLLKVTVNNL